MSEHGLLSLGASARNDTMQWISDDHFVYAGACDFCIVGKVNFIIKAEDPVQVNDEFYPEAILSVLDSPNSFRTFRVVDAARSADCFEAVGTTTDGFVVVYKVSRPCTTSPWSYTEVYKGCLSF